MKKGRAVTVGSLDGHVISKVQADEKPQVNVHDLALTMGIVSIRFSSLLLFRLFPGEDSCIHNLGTSFSI